MSQNLIQCTRPVCSTWYTNEKPSRTVTIQRTSRAIYPESFLSRTVQAVLSDFQPVGNCNTHTHSAELRGFPMLWTEGSCFPEPLRMPTNRTLSFHPFEVATVTRLRIWYNVLPLHVAHDIQRINHPEQKLSREHPGQYIQKVSGAERYKQYSQMSSQS